MELNYVLVAKASRTTLEKPWILYCTCMNLTYLLQVCQSLEAGRWLEEEKFEMTDSFPSAKVSH